MNLSKKKNLFWVLKLLNVKSVRLNLLSVKKMYVYNQMGKNLSNAIFGHLLSEIW